MGMDAELIALGHYDPAINDYLEYPNNYYDDTKPGTLVFSCCYVCGTTTESEELADALGIKPWDFNHHHFPTLSDDQLKSLGAFFAERSLASGEQDAIMSLRDAGFQFMYLPCG